jgi:hypothetical protein
MGVKLDERNKNLYIMITVAQHTHDSILDWLYPVNHSSYVGPIVRTSTTFVHLQLDFTSNPVYGCSDGPTEWN